MVSLLWCVFINDKSEKDKNGERLCPHFVSSKLFTRDSSHKLGLTAELSRQDGTFFTVTLATGLLQKDLNCSFKVLKV